MRFCKVVIGIVSLFANEFLLDELQKIPMDKDYAGSEVSCHKEQV